MRITTVGKVDFVVDFDGRALPAQAEKIGREFGDDMSAEASARFQSRFGKIAQELTPELQKNGTLSGHLISDAMTRALEQDLQRASSDIARAFLPANNKGLDAYASQFGHVDEAAAKLRNDLQLLADTGNLSDHMWNRFGGTLNQWLGNARKTEAETTRVKNGLFDIKVAVTDAERAFRDLSSIKSVIPGGGSGGGKNAASEGLEEQTNLWNLLSFNMRQAIVVIGVVAASGNLIATMGSAAAAGLTIFATAAAAAVAGLGVLVLGISGLVKELSDPKLKLTPQLKALKDFAAGFQALPKEVGNALLGGVGPVLTTFSNTFMKPLTKDLEGLGTIVGQALGGLLKNLSTPKSLSTIQTIFTDIGKLLPGLATAAESFGGALANIFVITAPFAQKFVGFLTTISKEFDDFTSSKKGRDEISQWLSNGVTILSSFGKLVAGVADVLADLVTPQTVKDTQGFLDALTASLPFLESLIKFASAGHVFELFATILNSVGNALKPILDILAPFLDIISTSLIASFQLLGEVLQLLLAPLELMAPIFEGIATVVKGFIDKELTVLNQIFQPLIQAFIDAGKIISVTLQPAFAELATAFEELIPSPKQLTDIINNDVVPAIKLMAAWFAQHGVEAIHAIIDVLHIVIPILLNDVPKGISATIKFLKSVKSAADTFVKIMQGPINALNTLLGLIDAITGAHLHIPTAAEIAYASQGGGHASGPKPLATGGIIHSARTLMGGSTGGEAGSEAIVPLMQPLNQVDPSVRWLSAIAQGKLGMGAPSKAVTIAPGAIVVVEAGNAEQTASAIFDRFVATAGT